MIASLGAGEMAVTVIRLLLAAVLLAAAVAKAADLAAARSAAIGLGVPERFAPAVAPLLVVVETLVAVALVVDRAALAGAIAAAALLAAFTVQVAWNLVRGRRPACGCFGSAASAPIGPVTVLRNVVLLAMAATIATIGLAGSRDDLGGVDDLSAGQAWALGASALVAVVVVANLRFTWNLLHQNGRMLERIEALEAAIGGDAPSGDRPHRSARRRSHHPGAQPARRTLAIGAMAPRFAGTDVRGATVTIDDLLGRRLPVVLVFLETTCAACVELGADVNVRGTVAGDRVLVAVVRGPQQDVVARFAGPGFDVVLVDDHGSIADRYHVAGTPTAVLVLPDGRIASAPAEGRAAATRLVHPELATLGAAAAPPALASPSPTSPPPTSPPPTSSAPASSSTLSSPTRPPSHTSLSPEVPTR